MNTPAQMRDKFNKNIKSKPLTVVIAFHVFIVLTLGMGAYSGIQYTLNPMVDVREMIFEHLIHIMFLMVLIYMVLHLTLHQYVVKPIQRFEEKLYLVSGGELTWLEESYGISEIRDMAEWINIMIDRFYYHTPVSCPYEIFPHVAFLREVAVTSSHLDAKTKQRLIDAANDIDRHLFHINQKLVKKSSNE